MEPIADSEIKRVLVVNAHPDDSDFGASGTIAQWVKAGIEVPKSESSGWALTTRTRLISLSAIGSICLLP